MKKRLYQIINVLLFVATTYLMFCAPEEEGVSQAFIGNIIRAIGANKQRKRLEGQRMDTDERIDEIKEFMPELNIDRSNYQSLVDFTSGNLDEAKSTARYRNIVAGQGRAPGDEIMRDENRRATANTVSRAMNTSSSASDVLGLLAIADAQQRSGDRNIDVQSAQIQQQERMAAQNRGDQLISQAQGAQGNSLMQFANFDYGAGMQEFQNNQLNPYIQATTDERALEAAIQGQRFAANESWASLADGAVNSALSLATAGITSGAKNLISPQVKTSR